MSAGDTIDVLRQRIAEKWSEPILARNVCVPYLELNSGHPILFPFGNIYIYALVSSVNTPPMVWSPLALARGLGFQQ